MEKNVDFFMLKSKWFSSFLHCLKIHACQRSRKNGCVSLRQRMNKTRLIDNGKFFPALDEFVIIGDGKVAKISTRFKWFQRQLLEGILVKLFTDIEAVYTRIGGYPPPPPNRSFPIIESSGIVGGDGKSIPRLLG